MNTISENCGSVILAGGENRRMPVLKGFIDIDGEKIIEKNLCMMKTLFRENRIVTNQPEVYTFLGVPLLGDIYDIRGPMTGIVTALLNSCCSWVFVSACDMPFLNPALIKYLATKTRGCDAVVPVISNKQEPLCAFYSKRLFHSMEKSLLDGHKSLRDFLNSKRVKYIKSSDMKTIDPGGLSFINLNTPQDIRRYLSPEDLSRFIKKREEGKCSDLEQLS
jgi:molybdopterin-guanine dinucleotide biosynthesis protein A